MINITHRPIEHDVADVAGHSIHVSGAETKIEVVWGSGGWAWSYRRPSQVRLDDQTTTVALRDYVMLNRVTTVLIAFLLMTKRRG